MIFSLQLEIYCFREDGTQYTKNVHLTCHGVSEGNGTIDYIEGVTRDITEELEKERDKYIGWLCHSLSQPLQAIGGLTDLISMSDDADKIKEWAKQLPNQMERVTQIMSKLHRIKEKTYPVKFRPYLDSVIVDLE